MIALLEVGISTVCTTIVASNVNADTLITALIGLGVSIVTVVGGELVKFLVAFLKNKTKKYEDSTEQKEEKKE